jgi:hypothetical protein
MNFGGKLVYAFGLATILSLAGARAGGAAQVVLSDPLSTWPLNFGAQGTEIMLKDGAVHIVTPVNDADWVMYSGFTFSDMDASVTVAPQNANGNAAGLLFWAAATNNFFDFAISDTYGKFAVYHYVAGAATPWTPIVPYTVNAAIKTGAGATNTLRIVTKGNYVTLYINGQSVGGLSLMQPTGGGSIGIEGESTTKGVADYAFSNLTVSQ